VLELADRQDLGSCAERREGSSPSFPTSLQQCSDIDTYKIIHLARNLTSSMLKSNFWE
jgi:hypothetical protein